MSIVVAQKVVSKAEGRIRTPRRRDAVGARDRAGAASSRPIPAWSR